MSREYITDKIYGLPKPLSKGHNTSPTKDGGKEYLHKVSIKGYAYFKVHIKRQNVSKIKYFKKRKDAVVFIDMLKENRYL